MSVSPDTALLRRSWPGKSRLWWRRIDQSRPVSTLHSKIKGVFWPVNVLNSSRNILRLILTRLFFCLFFRHAPGQRCVHCDFVSKLFFSSLENFFDRDLFVCIGLCLWTCWICAVLFLVAMESCLLDFVVSRDITGREKLSINVCMLKLEHGLIRVLFTSTNVVYMLLTFTGLSACFAWQEHYQELTWIFVQYRNGPRPSMFLLLLSIVFCLYQILFFVAVLWLFCIFWLPLFVFFILQQVMSLFWREVFGLYINLHSYVHISIHFMLIQINANFYQANESPVTLWHASLTNIALWFVCWLGA